MKLGIRAHAVGALPFILVSSLGLGLLSPSLPEASETTLQSGNCAVALKKEDIESALKKAYSKYKNLKQGKNADYIPALAKVPSELFGIALVTTDGRVYSIGDSDSAFSIQSISKVFTLAHVLQESGGKVVEDTIGVDATGKVFNSITAIEENKGRDINPLVNPGAIATTALVQGNTADEIWGKILGTHSDFAGRKLQINPEVYQSEAATNQRNQAISLIMQAYDRIKKNPLQATDLYTKQCSINVNTKDLASMAATLANAGIHPLTKKRVIDREHIREILAVMATAGLYNNSGKWLFATGLPAKSGVGGGIIAVSPGKFGIAAFSPRLDASGNSIRAQHAIADINLALGGNPYDVKPAH